MGVAEIEREGARANGYGSGKKNAKNETECDRRLALVGRGLPVGDVNVCVKVSELLSPGVSCGSSQVGQTFGTRGIQGDTVRELDRRVLNLGKCLGIR